jgi:hypothetical protein
MTINIESIMRRVAALSEKTTANGCTESEAMSAAEKVASMLAEHGLSLSDIEIKERKDCEKGEIVTGRKRSHAVVWTIMAIGYFCDVKVWRDRSRANGISFNFFGFPEDVSAAKSMYHMILNAMDCALVDYKRECYHQNLPTGRRQSAAFHKGMATRIATRLGDMKRAQDRENKETTGRELVVVKDQAVSTEFAKLDLRLRTTTQRATYGDRGAYEAGEAAGSRVGFNKGVTGGSQELLT